MKTVGLLVCGPGEAERYLAATLDEFERLCDEVVVAGNNTDKKTEAAIRRRGFFFYRDDREWGIHQPSIKTDLLRRIGGLRPDIVVPLDADETFAGGFGRDELEALAATNAVAWYFYIVNLWNSPDRYWPAGSFWNIRAFRWRPDLGSEFLKKNVHCGLAPPWAYQHGRYAPFHVRHSGLMVPADREKKIERYKLYDPRRDKVGIGAYYEALAGQGDGAAYDEAALQSKVTAEVERINQPDKKVTRMSKSSNEFVIVRRLKDGREIDIPKADLEATMKRGGFEIIREIKLNAMDAKIQVPLVPDQLECPVCGAVCSDDEDLADHKEEHGTPKKLAPKPLRTAKKAKV